MSHFCLYENPKILNALFNKYYSPGMSYLINEKRLKNKVKTGWLEVSRFVPIKCEHVPLKPDIVKPRQYWVSGECPGLSLLSRCICRG